MSNNKFSVMSIILLMLGLAGIFSLRYHNNLQDMVKEDGGRWSKPKIIMKAGLNTDIGAGKYGENYILAFNNEDKLEILSVNNRGEILKQVSNEIGSKFINDIDVNINNDEIYITYAINIGGEKNFNMLKLNEGLEIVENDKIKDVKRSINIKNEVYALVYEDRIEIRDRSKVYSSIHEKVSTIDFIDEDGYQILVYGNAEGEYRYIKLDNSSIIEPKTICKTSVGQGVSYDHMSVSINEENLYLTFQQNHKNVFQDSIYYKYSLMEEKLLDNGKINIGNTKVKNITSLGDNSFFGTIKETKGMKTTKTSLIEFTFGDSMKTIFKEKIATYNKGYNYISKAEDRLFIGVFNAIGDYDLVMVRPAQSIDDYKVTKMENKLLMQSAGEGIVYAMGFSFVFFLISAVVYGIIFAAYSCLTILSEGKKGIIGISIFSIFLLIIKCYIITNKIMTMCYMYMPHNFKSIPLWIGLNVVISFIMWCVGILDILKSKKEVNLMKIYSLSLIDVFLSYTLIFTFVM